MAEKIYWKGIEEKEQLEGYKQVADKEFSEELPVLSSITEPISTGKSNRRDFLKMLGFSVTAATIAASCEMPVRKSIPYIWRPEEIAPGIANYYASTFYQNGDYCAVLVKTREGRPIKIEGRESKNARVTKGGTSPRAQASVLSLYDGGRYRNPMRGKENITWEKADAEIGEKLKAANGKVVLFSSSIISPSTNAAIAEFGKSLGGDKFQHLVYDSISYSGMLDANDKTFGKRLIPSYNFAKAKVIVSIGADFLGTWLSPVEFSADYALNRRVSKEKSDMSRHIQIEAVPTMTGYKADKRVPVKPSEELAALVDIYNVVTGGSAKNEKYGKIAQELMGAKGESLLVVGSNDVNAQILANAVNNALGNYGTTITWDRPYNTKQGSDKAITNLIEGLNNGSIKAVLFYESNPVFTSPVKGLAEALKKADVSVSFANRLDETSAACSYVAPDSHWLESWNDGEPKAGIFNLTQPAISKLFDTRQFGDTMLRWAGKEGSYYDYIQQYWESNIYGKQKEYTAAFWAFWDNAVRDAEVETAGADSKGSFNGSGAADAASALVSTASSLGDVQVKFYESIAIGDGYWADNPWLQELPDPVSKITWDNYIIASPIWMNKNGYNIDPDFKEKRYAVAKLTVNGQSVELPVAGVPGTPEGVFGVALGYGREAVVNDELKNGKNVFGFLTSKDGGFTNIAKATIEKTDKTEQLAITQTHFNIRLKDLGGVKTRKVVKETILKDYKKDPAAGNEDRKEILEELVTLYYKHDYPGPNWSMVIDLNTCTGCGACVVACNAENNVPVVGKDQVRRSREMHWLRIDRYYTGTEENPDVVFQPMLCQQCNNAPCENVCPVAATNHSSEGLNQMVYNRCIGTRYCANNCPYKVRRFNWYDYQQADSFDKKWGTDNNRPLSEATLSMHEPLTRMVLNPDVTVRCRGVMEKCSFCVQRLQAGKLEAKKGNRVLADMELNEDGTVRKFGDVSTACQTACPTNAITFGDRNNKESVVYKKFNDERAFGVIEDLHTMPNIMYLTQVRNRDEEKVYEVLDYYHDKV
ncbi:MAG TPA: TAT-variant-translocated molybdopterin oxidoreductase [Chitinophagales bacterium]|nr:TAT-variant-translocated molybdopterin oxidoreductase [Chitinophagales bacterium]